MRKSTILMFLLVPLAAAALSPALTSARGVTHGIWTKGQYVEPYRAGGLSFWQVTPHKLSIARFVMTVNCDDHTTRTITLESRYMHAVLLSSRGTVVHDIQPGSPSDPEGDFAVEITATVSHNVLHGYLSASDSTAPTQCSGARYFTARWNALLTRHPVA